jgi:AraC-like DNA-binding protein
MLSVALYRLQHFLLGKFFMAMQYKQYLPSVALRPYVKCFYIWEQTGPLAKPVEIFSPPAGLGGIVFNWGDPYSVLNEQGKWERVPYFFIAGQFTRSYTLRLSGSVGMLGIVFWPAALSYILSIPMATFTDLRTDLNLIIGKEAALLEHHLLESSCLQHRIAVFEKFLLKKIYKIENEPNVVDKALRTIVQHKGILSISQLADELCISPRQLRRRFIEKVGVSPKMLSRIKRFNYISNLSQTQLSNWSDIVQEGGYYDQAHFIRDFSDFSGKKPTEYMNFKRDMALLVGA